MACRKSKLHVTKTLGPDQPGAVRLTQKYGDALLCVRYRQDALGLVRYTTVELIVDEAQISASSKRTVGAGSSTPSSRPARVGRGLRVQPERGVYRRPARSKEVGHIELVTYSRRHRRRHRFS